MLNFEDAALRQALAARDIGAVFRLVVTAGVSQRRLAELVKMSQSEVCEIIKGRRVLAYDVLVRVAEGLDVPRAWMGLAYDQEDPGGLPVGEVDENMKRRALLAAGALALVGTPALGEVLHIPHRPATPTPLPARLGASDVAAIRNLTDQLRGVSRAYGGGAEVLSKVANQSLPLMSVPASNHTKIELGSALAELHTLAGWCCVDSDYHDNARAHFAHAMDLAAASHDGYQIGSALHHAGIHMRDAGAYNDDLKACQLGLIKLAEFPCSAHTDTAMAWLHIESALALAAMGNREAAHRALNTAHEQPMPTVFDSADMDYRTSCVYRHLGQIDAAEAATVTSLRKWAAEKTSRRDSVLSEITLATLHTHTAQPDSTVLAQRAIHTVASLQSGRARAALTPLADALSTRRDATSRELAQHAKMVSQSA